MSGSDLAPFVAAVLKDRTVAEMIQEIDKLKSRQTESENERLLVQITGTNGTPVHYEESFKNAERYTYEGYRDSPHIHVCFDDGSSHDLTTDGLPLSSLHEIEIRLGGVVVQRINIDDLNVQFEDDLYDEENRMEYIMVQHINRRHLSGLGHAGGDILLKDLLELVADETNDLTPQTLIINELIFDEKDLTPGIMSFIKK
ncbi:hypothetical protein FRACYDRAFT_244832 [Fragilariopsis cylindrus CCMP1102]|uniref:Uncharacterized protein n=1 Tax=Fragilariopsis cylindrus CCMP1102 TaxID=635003 RepID=A0A1E7F0S6_9STRA|nr:hypothetical protein FRACYDRAFT_244832 [Fragilariopsis cylindrus CCMP1102]|eukprot:OEU11709.1 hypothetical protein FRACYDRAFT_244832 [Fragilariopsis cylindrus CCMP1102]